MVQDNREELYFAGMESVRTDWSELARRFQRELYWRLFHQSPIADWIEARIQELLRGELDHELVIRKTLRKPIQEYTTTVPQHVRAARMLPRPGRSVAYVVTKDGPIPVELKPANPDYQYYIDKQLRPIAESVLWLPEIDLQFADLLGNRQLRLF